MYMAAKKITWIPSGDRPPVDVGKELHGKESSPQHG